MSRPLLRDLLRVLVPSDPELEAFCLDHFPIVQQQFSCGMNRLSKVNLLLEINQPLEIFARITETFGAHRIERTISQIKSTLDISLSAEMDLLRDQLNGLYISRAQLKLEKQSTSEIDERILQIKRRQRERPNLREGEVLNHRFRLIDVIGRGGFAKVWLAMDFETKMLVAVKVLHVDQAEDNSRLTRFRRGALQFKGLFHPYLIRIIDGPHEEAGFHYYAMEFMPRGDLHAAVIEGRIERMQALRILLDAGGALDFAHDQGLIHRDVKPQNILIASDFGARVTDFDLVLAADSTGGTRTGAMGTFFYAAPEQMKDMSRVDRRVDVYSLAMTAMFILSGRPLSPHDVFRRLEFIEELDCGAIMRDTLRAATAIDPEERPATIKELCIQLQQALKEPSGLTIPLSANNFYRQSLSLNATEASRMRNRNVWQRLAFYKRTPISVIAGILILTIIYRIGEIRRNIFDIPELQRPEDGCLIDAQCRQEYDEAVKSFESGQFTSAYLKFRTAFETRQMPWLLINIGRSAHRMGRPADALDCYDRYWAAEAHPDSETAERLNRYMQQAKALLQEANSGNLSGSCAGATFPAAVHPNAQSSQADMGADR